MKLNRFPYYRIYVLTGVIILGGVLTNCIETIDLPVNRNDINFLVVDGFLNTANGEVNLRLMRATLINESQTPFESRAAVSLEDTEGNLSLLVEQDSGRYKGTAPSLDVGKQYRLYIKTSNGKEYRSAFVTIRPTPPIDSVAWRADADGTQIVIDTHDATHQTRYYRWTFEETWEYRSWYKSWWVFNDTTPLRVRNYDEFVHICFKTERSTKIFTTTTANLTEDVVNDYEIQFLPLGTEKLSQNYSIIVRQYAISKETYDYLEKLKKTSQDLGGLYAPQPSKVTGNMVNVADTSEVVLGYFDAGQVTEKRIYIKYQDLPDHLRVHNWWVLCYRDTVNGTLNPKTHTILEEVPPDEAVPGQASEWLYSTIECSDCRVRGGVITKPDYMPNPNRW